MSKLRLVFFGSGPVAAQSLELLAREFEIEAVVTKPRPLHHREAFPVLESAEKLGLSVHTVSNRAELSALITTKPFTSPFAVLIDFGIIVGQDTIDYFPKGIVNSHFSLLPQWRGADPITFAILSGQEETGVSLMLLVEKMDEGPLLAQSEVKIEPDETTPSLTEKLVTVSDALLRVILPEWLVNKVDAGNQLEVSILQDNTPTYSRKLTKEDGRIIWTKPAEVIEREIRAFIGWPKSYTQLAGKDVVITKASVLTDNGESGTTEVKGKQLIVFCGEGSLIIENLKPAGKNEMTAAEFLRGYGKNF